VKVVRRTLSNTTNQNSNSSKSQQQQPNEVSESTATAAAFAIPPSSVTPLTSSPPSLPSPTATSSSTEGPSIASQHMSKVQFAIESLLKPTPTPTPTSSTTSFSSSSASASMTTPISDNGSPLACPTLLSIVQHGFDAKVPIEEANTPPAEWYELANHTKLDYSNLLI
jgi:hypothetical protein